MEHSAKKIEIAVMNKDLRSLSESEKLQHYKHMCENFGFSADASPFEYLFLNKKLVLYATKSCSDQLRNQRNVSIEIVSREVINNCYVVSARAKMDNRVDESIGAVPLLVQDTEYVNRMRVVKKDKNGNPALRALVGEEIANALMKAETKAKRRVTLSICGLGMLDETEIASIPDSDKQNPAKQITKKHINNAQAHVAVEPEQVKNLIANKDIKRNEETPEFVYWGMHRLADGTCVSGLRIKEAKAKLDEIPEKAQDGEDAGVLRSYITSLRREMIKRNGEIVLSDTKLLSEFVDIKGILDLNTRLQRVEDENHHKQISRRIKIIENEMKCKNTSELEEDGKI